MKCQFRFVFCFLLFLFEFFFVFCFLFFFFWVKHCLRICKKYRVDNTTLMTWKHFSHLKTRVKLLREIFVWKIFFPCSVETTKEGYCLRYRLCRLENSMAFSFFLASENTQRASFRPSGNFFCLKYLVFSLMYRLLSPQYFSYCKNWQKGTTMIGLEY